MFLYLDLGPEGDVDVQMRTRHASLRAMAGFLKTRTEPVLVSYLAIDLMTG